MATTCPETQTHPAARTRSFSSIEGNLQRVCHRRCTETNNREDKEVDNENDSFYSAEENEAHAELDATLMLPSIENHSVADEQDTRERESEQENVDPNVCTPLGKWPILKYVSFQRLRLADLRARPVTVVPGIGDSAAARLFQLGVHTV